MSKFMLFLCIVLLATTVIIAAPRACRQHGDPCTGTWQCCRGAVCHKYAHRCQVMQITRDQLLNGREKVMNGMNMDY
ncbi:PREDICTED: omega-conotoxin-like protein 1 [Eufriesea mexicana]|uniref:omega-conotoxin-like protein 1 n=1 Tax=Eufriesea mexicana TaxID=516756 RepID=UPI00083C6C49|nr:PREDICTED: omega-conotoxin-like protein 1 [Eufriesea mexicana]